MPALTKQKKKEFTIIGFIVGTISTVHLALDNLDFSFLKQEEDCKTHLIMCPANMTIQNVIYRNEEIAGWECEKI